MRQLLCAVACAALLSGCANGNVSSGAAAEYQATPLGNDVWQVSYVSGDYASREVAQSRWLYRCALLALEQGYEGFEVVSEIPLTNVDLDASPLLGYQAPRAQSFQPVYLATEDAAFEADIRLLPAVAAATPPKTFDAQALKRALEVIVHPQQTAQVDIY